MTGRVPRSGAVRLAAALAALAFGVSGSVRAQDDDVVVELVTDRPDQTESAVVVPVGTLQVEGGATWIRDDGDGVEIEAFEAPGTLLRYGLVPRLELRLAWPGILTAMVLSFAHTLGEFGIVLMVGGSIPGETRTVAIAIYDRVQAFDDAAAAQMSALLLAISLVAIALTFAFSRRIGRRLG